MQQIYVDLIIGEPFDFPVNHMVVAVLAQCNKKLLLKLPKGVFYKNNNITQLLATPRDCEKSFDELQRGECIIVNMLPILEIGKLSLDMCVEYAKKWRGWFLIGTIEIKKRTMSDKNS